MNTKIIKNFTYKQNPDGTISLIQEKDIEIPDLTQEEINQLNQEEITNKEQQLLAMYNELQALKASVSGGTQ